MNNNLQEEENNFLIKRQAELGQAPSIKRMLEVWEVEPKVLFMLKSNKNYYVLFSVNLILALFIISGCIFLFVKTSNLFNLILYFLCAIYILISLKLYKKRFKNNKNTEFSMKLFENIDKEHLKYLSEKVSKSIKGSYKEYLRTRGTIGKLVVYLVGMSSAILTAMKKIPESAYFSKIINHINTNNEIIINILAVLIVIIFAIVIRNRFR